MYKDIRERRWTFEEAIAGKELPQEIRDNICLTEVDYLSFEGDTHTGHLLVHRVLEKEIKDIFKDLLEIQYPIERIIPICFYGWDDETSMQANNSSALNYRCIIGTNQLSNHSYGWAVDLNPRLNPYFARDGEVYPAGATYDPMRIGTIVAGDAVVTIFKQHGWEWGGDWIDRKDYQHFQKPLN